jgi:hypothetical protein
LGKAKRLHANDVTEEERSAYCCRPTKAVAVNEGSLGSKKKSGRKQVRW